MQNRILDHRMKASNIVHDWKCDAAEKNVFNEDTCNWRGLIVCQLCSCTATISLAWVISWLPAPDIMRRGKWTLARESDEERSCSRTRTRYARWRPGLGFQSQLHWLHVLRLFEWCAFQRRRPSSRQSRAGLLTEMS